jgi:CubicO group peptidase (beta-lactamase class C family)
MTRRKFAALGGAALSAARTANAAANPGIDVVLREGIAKHGIPTVAAMFSVGEKTLYSGAFGVRDASGAPVTVDSIFSIASMTKAVTTVAALQMVEKEDIELDAPVGKVLRELAKIQVVEGFDAAGEPILRPAKTPVTLRHLLTHTSGLAYSNWDEAAFRYSQKPGRPPALMFEPGTRWQYGTGIDWAGTLVERLSGMTLEEYFQVNILRRLDMADTSYILPAAKFDRLVTGARHNPDGTWKHNERKMPVAPKSFGGGGGLYSTVADYTRFMQMILGNGRGINTQGILQPKTMQWMKTNQIGPLTAGKMKSFEPATSADVDIQPGQTEKWTLAFLQNTDPCEGGRSAGSLAWAGLFNTFYWIDPARNACGVLMMQFLPFVDPAATALLTDFERAAYRLV